MSQGLFTAVESLGQVIVNQRQLIETQAHQLQAWEKEHAEQVRLTREALQNAACARAERDSLKIALSDLREERRGDEKLAQELSAALDEQIKLKELVAHLRDTANWAAEEREELREGLEASQKEMERQSQKAAENDLKAVRFDALHASLRDAKSYGSAGMDACHLLESWALDAGTGL